MILLPSQAKRVRKKLPDVWFLALWQLYWKLWTVTNQTACHLDWSERIMFIAFVSFYYLFIALWYRFRSVHSYCDVHNPSPSPRDFNLMGPCDNPVLWACGSWGNEMPRFVYAFCSSLPRHIQGHWRAPEQGRARGRRQRAQIQRWGEENVSPSCHALTSSRVQS